MPCFKPHDSGLKHGERSINASWPRRLAVVAAVKVARLFNPQLGTILFLPRNLFVKCGPLRHLPEASTLEFVARNTQIPVPKVYCAFKWRETTYIVMERIKGESLVRSWLSRSDESKKKILQQLKTMIESMRSLKPPSLAVSNVDGGCLWDGRVTGTTLYFGPFNDINAFHRHLRRGLDHASDLSPSDVAPLIEWHNQDFGRPVFTHGDLSSLNIMAEGDTITGIIDWETSGWYPEYWEYTTAHQVNPFNLFWEEEIDKFLQAYPSELEMDLIRQKYFGDI